MRGKASNGQRLAVANKTVKITNSCNVIGNEFKAGKASTVRRLTLVNKTTNELDV